MAGAFGVLGKKVRTAARNISEKALCLIQTRRGFYKKVEKATKYELRIC